MQVKNKIKTIVFFNDTAENIAKWTVYQRSPIPESLKDIIKPMNPPKAVSINQKINNAKNI